MTEHNDTTNAPAPAGWRFVGKMALWAGIGFGIGTLVGLVLIVVFFILDAPGAGGTAFGLSCGLGTAIGLYRGFISNR